MLEEWTPQNAPYYHQITQRNLDLVLGLLEEREKASGTDEAG